MVNIVIDAENDVKILAEDFWKLFQKDVKVLVSPQTLAALAALAVDLEPVIASAVLVAGTGGTDIPADITLTTTTLKALPLVVEFFKQLGIEFKEPVPVKATLTAPDAVDAVAVTTLETVTADSFKPHGFTY
jgi:hypothetical protein